MGILTPDELAGLNNDDCKCFICRDNAIILLKILNNNEEELICADCLGDITGLGDRG